MGGTRFMVQWEEHPSHLATRLGQLLEHQTLVDVTLMCNTHTLRVHRAVLAACSPYFETILQRQLGMHPLIVLKDMQFSVLKSLIEFMYCGETSVTEDNLGALLQAAKFFQVKGLSAMTKEALGLVPNTKSTINGDAARKAFVGRPKRVGMQQTFVTSGLKTVPASHASGSHSSAVSNELPTLPTKTTFQTISKPITARPDTQQQADTAQLLLSLSGSEFPKQTFHTVSKNVRFQHNVSGSTVSVESPRSSNVEGNVKNKEVVGRIPVMTANGGKTTIAAATAAATTTVPQQGGQLAEPTAVGHVREDVLVTNPQSVYLAEGHRRRGRPVKRQMNMLFQERVMTDADAALHKEAEASRKALEMLRQEMSSEPMETNVAASSNVTVPVPVTPAVVPTPIPTATSVSSLAQISNVTGEHVQKGLVKHSVQGGTKIQVQSVQTPIATTSRTVTTQNISAPSPTKRMNSNVFKATSMTNNTVSNVTAKKNLQPVSSLPLVENSNNSSVNALVKVEEAEIPQQMFELSDEVVQEPPKEESVEYQVSGENVEGETDGAKNTNIVYQVADSNSASAGSVMSQYMEVLKEAGLPTDVPILLDSGDGSYVTVNEEVLMNIVNGGVLQCHVTEGNFVSGDGVEFIVQEITEDEMEAVQAQVQEQSGEIAALPKEMENNCDATNVENSVGSSDIKLPTEEGTQLTQECMDTTQEKPAILEEEETSDPEVQNMEINSEIAPSDEIPKQESHEIISAAVDDVCSEQNAEKVDDVPDMSEICNENAPEVENNLELKTESESQSGVEKSVNDESNFENNSCSTELSNNENDLPNLEHVKAESNDEMSVEQALEAMMGESSDTEIEPCANTEDQGPAKDESVVTGLETITQSLKEEKSEDLHLVLRNEEGTEEGEREEEEEEDLRLVLSNDGCDASNDSSSSYSLVRTERVADTDSVTQENPENTTDIRESVDASELSNEVPQEMGMEVMSENVNKISVPDCNEFESVTEQSGEIEHVVEPSQVESISKEATSLECTAVEEENTAPKVDEAQEVEGTEFEENVPGSEVSGDSQEVSQLTSNAVASPAEAACNSATEYSQSKGKESAPDMPAARVKRKASSSDGPDKKLKLSTAKEETEMEPFAEEAYDGDTTMEIVASSIPEERKEETVLSMPELVTDPTEG